MKILLLIPDLTQGGAERQAVNLANGLAGRGHAVGLALFRYQGGLLDLVAEDVAVHDLKKGGQADVVGFLSRLHRLVRQERPDVIYSFLGVPNLAAVCLKAFGNSVPVVWGIRASDVDLSQYGWLSRACHAAERRLARFADKIIVNSEAGRRHAVEQGFPAGSMSVVYNGINTEIFRPDVKRKDALRREWGASSETTLVGTVGRLDPMKGHDVLIRAAAVARQSDSSLRFVCVGEGDLRQRLEQGAREAGVSEHIVWAGARTDMVDVYNAMDMLCLPSVSEGFPNVLGEAMACGVPCVTTDVGDAAMIVGDTGRVVIPGDADALARGIVELAELVRQPPRSNVRERIESLFSLERMVSETEARLATLVTAPR